MSKTVLFQTIPFTISTQFCSLWLLDRTLSGATTPGLKVPGSDGNERILHIPQSSNITGPSLLDFLASYAGHSLGWESLHAAGMQSVYSAAQAD